MRKKRTFFISIIFLNIKILVYFCSLIDCPLMFSLPHFNSESERRTFRIHTFYSVLEGVVLGVLALNEFVFLKSLKGSDLQIGILFQFSVMVLSVSIIINEWVRRIKNKTSLLWKIGLITRLPLLLFVFFPKDAHTLVGFWYHYIFLALFLIYYSASPVILPVINLILKQNYEHKNFSQFYSYSQSLNKVVMMLVTLVYGITLDYWAQAYTIALPLIAVLGIISLFVLSTIKYDVQWTKPPVQSLWSSAKESILNMRVVVSKNGAFRNFEIGFMFYGFAFMGTISVITIFYDKTLHLNYSSIAFYKNSYNILAILLLPFFGRLLSKIDPKRFAAITYAALFLYLLFTLLTGYLPFFIEIYGIKIYFLLMLAIVFHGFFAATMALLWSIGSAYFCEDNEAAHFQSIHLTLTGLRSFLAPALGIGLYELFGYTFTFILGCTFLLIAVLFMLKRGVSHSENIASNNMR